MLSTIRHTDLSALKRKRRSSDSSDTTNEQRVRQRLVILGPEDDLPVFEDSESCHSYQDRETDLARDTSDTSDGSSLEFTVAELTDGKASDTGSSESSNLNEDIKKIARIIILEDIGLLGGSSESDTDHDSELPQADFWSCKCGAKKNNPRFGTCEKCFKTRRSFFPTRPRRKLRRRAEKKAIQSTSQSNSEPIDLNTIGPSSSLTTTMSQASSQALSQASSQASSSDLSSQTREGNKCNVCQENSIDGIFVHGNSGHDYACYRCSLKMYKAKKYCPICNRAVNNVIRLYKSINS